MKALRVIVFVLSFALIYGWVFYRIILSYNQPSYDEIVNLNMNCKLLTHKHNEVNHMLNDALERNRDLEAANEALMRELNKANRLGAAIKNTPLPKMKEA